MNINEALHYIHAIPWTDSVPTLRRAQSLLARMGNPERNLKFIHIAGTNGKGSTAAMLAAMLRAAGHRTGLYTSPYILRFNERMQVDGVPISDAELVRLTKFVRPLADSLADPPTEFELVTCIAMEHFARSRCEIVVLEVGMGGEFDATNVIDSPEAAVITRIGLDHTKVLGGTVEEIAQAKAGVIKPGCDCVLYAQQPGVEAVFARACACRGARLRRADPAHLRPLSRGLDGQRFDWKNLANLYLPLLGEHQLRNAGVALSAVEVLAARGWRVPETAVREGLAGVRWPGRFQLLREEPPFIVDGGHNPQCLEALAAALRDYLPSRKITFLCGCMADKDCAEMFGALAPCAREFVTVAPRGPRALPAPELAERLRGLGLCATPCPTIERGVRTAIDQAGAEGAVCACGSLYLIADVENALKDN